MCVCVYVYCVCMGWLCMVLFLFPYGSPGFVLSQPRTRWFCLTSPVLPAPLLHPPRPGVLVTLPERGTCSSGSGGSALSNLAEFERSIERGRAASREGKGGRRGRERLKGLRRRERRRTGHSLGGRRGWFYGTMSASSVRARYAYTLEWAICEWPPKSALRPKGE
jgi:hypothetical protein